jgi:AsmA protein
VKRILKIGAIAAALLFVILIALPFLINVNSFRPKIESEMTTALGRQVTVGNLSLSILSGSVVAHDIAVADDPSFSKAPFITAKSLKVGVELIPLVFSKQLNMTEIKLEQPQITLLKASSGKWNFSSIGGASDQKSPVDAKSGGSFAVAKLNVSNGKLIVGKANSSAKPQVYNEVAVNVKNFSFTSQFQFKLTAQLPGGGNVNILGKAGPISAGDAAKTPFETAVKVNNMDIAASGFIDPASGLGGLASLDGTLNSDGSHAKAVGTLTGTKLKLSAKGTAAPRTLIFKHTVDVDLAKQIGTLTQGDVAIGKAVAHLTGSFQTKGDTQFVSMKLDASEMPVDELAPMLPSLGVVLPSGSQLQGGTLSATLGVAGALDKLVITGPVRLANTKLAGFDLGSQLGALSAFAGKSASNRDTSIQNASLSAHVAPEGTKADNINLTVPAIGIVTGAGTVSPAGALNFKMLADLKGGAMGGLTQVASLGSGKSGIPFAVEGTTSNPHVVPDMTRVASGVAKGALGEVTSAKKVLNGSPQNTIGGLLGKKQK